MFIRQHNKKVKLEVLEKGTEQPIIAANVIYADNEALRNPQYAITNTSGQAELKLPSKGICYYKVTYIGYVPVTGEDWRDTRRKKKSFI
mgnify:CR=1 FL=1